MIFYNAIFKILIVTIHLGVFVPANDMPSCIISRYPDNCDIINFIYIIWHIFYTRQIQPLPWCTHIPKTVMVIRIEIETFTSIIIFFDKRTAILRLVVVSNATIKSHPCYITKNYFCHLYISPKLSAFFFNECWELIIQVIIQFVEIREPTFQFTEFRSVRMNQLMQALVINKVL